MWFATTDDRYRLAPALREGGWVGGVTGQIFRAAQPWLDKLVAAQEESVVLGAPTAELDVRILSHRSSPLAIRFEVSRRPRAPRLLYRDGARDPVAHALKHDSRAYLENTSTGPN